MVKSKKVNLGCGSVALEGWCNLDSSYRVWIDRIPYIHLLGYKPRFSKSVQRWDARKSLPFLNQTISHVYSSHMIEHIPKKYIEGLLKECFRVLEPGGRIRLVTPNVCTMAENYLERLRNDKLKSTAADHFAKSLFVFPETESSNPILKVLHQFQENKNVHQWLYDEQNLSFLLTQVGFKNVVSKNNWFSDFPDLSKLEMADQRGGAVCSEGVKLT